MAKLAQLAMPTITNALGDVAFEGVLSATRISTMPSGLPAPRASRFRQALCRRARFCITWGPPQRAGSRRRRRTCPGRPVWRGLWWWPLGRPSQPSDRPFPSPEQCSYPRSRVVALFAGWLSSCVSRAPSPCHPRRRAKGRPDIPLTNGGPVTRGKFPGPMNPRSLYSGPVFPGPVFPGSEFPGLSSLA